MTTKLHTFPSEIVCCSKFPQFVLETVVTRYISLPVHEPLCYAKWLV